MLNTNKLDSKNEGIYILILLFCLMLRLVMIL